MIESDIIMAAIFYNLLSSGSSSSTLKGVSVLISLFSPDNEFIIACLVIYFDV